MRQRCHGQALLETLVALTALVPLLMGMAWLARMMDRQQLTVMAVREAAFDCAWRPESCGDGAGEIPLSLQPLMQTRATVWHSPAGHSGRAAAPEVQVHREPLSFDMPLSFAGGSASRVIPQAVSVLSDLAGPGRFGLDLESGLRRTDVLVRPAAGPERWALQAFSSGPVRHEARLALLTNDWMARAPEGEWPDTVRSRVERGQQVPGLETLLRAGAWPVRGLLQIAEWIGLESSARHFQPLSIDIDRVPPDRLGLEPWPPPDTGPVPVMPPEPGGGTASSEGA